MGLLYDLVLVVHFLGLASLIGGALVQLSVREGRGVNAAMVHGALTQVVTGLIMVGLAEGVDSLDQEVDNAKIGVKLVVAVAVAALCWVNRRRPTIPDGLFFLILGLSAANVVVAVFWS